MDDAARLLRALVPEEHRQRLAKPVVEVTVGLVQTRDRWDPLVAVLGDLLLSFSSSSPNGSAPPIRRHLVAPAAPRCPCPQRDSATGCGVP
jgi:hypothetical protein